MRTTTIWNLKQSGTGIGCVSATRIHWQVLAISSRPESLADFLGDQKELVENWPLETLRPVHQETHTINCNWKIYWKNFSECYHCPRIHTEYPGDSAPSQTQQGQTIACSA